MCLGEAEVRRGELLFCRYTLNNGRGEKISSHEKIPTSDNTGKVVWFYAPIAIMLLLNTLGCVQIVRLLCANENRKLQLHLREPKKRHEKMDRCEMKQIATKLKENQIFR